MWVARCIVNSDSTSQYTYDIHIKLSPQSTVLKEKVVALNLNSMNLSACFTHYHLDVSTKCIRIILPPL